MQRERLAIRRETFRAFEPSDVLARSLLDDRGHAAKRSFY